MAADSDAITVEVRYSRDEYLAFVEEFMPYGLTAKKSGTSPWSVQEPTVRPGSFTKFLVRGVASISFLYKVSRVGDYRFSFSDAGLLREAKDGILNVPWDEVQRVFRLQPGFLFAKENGAMPVPYRALGAGQREAIELLLAASGHAPKNAV
jgi:hypothetical protein